MEGQMKYFEGKRILITGGTGSLGKRLIYRLLNNANQDGTPEKIFVFSRDETKQHKLRLKYKQLATETDEIIYSDFTEKVQFIVGNVRDFQSIKKALRKGVDVVLNAAALKQVPTCEYHPYESVKTNIVGPENIVRAISNNDLTVETVVGISTDKACKPVNVYGMCKAIQERILLEANLDISGTRFICVRYGNVIASRGSVVPLFRKQIKSGGPLTITSKKMTRFFISLDEAVDTIFKALKRAKKGETYIPKVPSMRIVDLAKCLSEGHSIEIEEIGIRPGEKLNEILISEEESTRVYSKENYYVLSTILPELSGKQRSSKTDVWEFSSGKDPMTKSEVCQFLGEENQLIE